MCGFGYAQAQESAMDFMRHEYQRQHAPQQAQPVSVNQNYGRRGWSSFAEWSPPQDVAPRHSREPVRAGPQVHVDNPDFLNYTADRLQTKSLAKACESRKRTSRPMPQAIRRMPRRISRMPQWISRIRSLQLRNEQFRKSMRRDTGAELYRAAAGGRCTDRVLRSASAIRLGAGWHDLATRLRCDEGARQRGQIRARSRRLSSYGSAAARR